MAYCPLNMGVKAPSKDLFERETIIELAAKYGKTPAQIILNWGIQRGYNVLTKSSKPERHVENFGALSFKLEPEDVEKIKKLNKNMNDL